MTPFAAVILVSEKSEGLTLFVYLFVCLPVCIAYISQSQSSQILQLFQVIELQKKIRALGLSKAQVLAPSCPEFVHEFFVLGTETQNEGTAKNILEK